MKRDDVSLVITLLLIHEYESKSKDNIVIKLNIQFNQEMVFNKKMEILSALYRDRFISNITFNTKREKERKRER
jgi:hypothetical protein